MVINVTPVFIDTPSSHISDLRLNGPNSLNSLGMHAQRLLLHAYHRPPYAGVPRENCAQTKLRLKLKVSLPHEPLFELFLHI